MEEGFFSLKIPQNPVRISYLNTVKVGRRCKSSQRHFRISNHTLNLISDLILHGLGSRAAFLIIDNMISAIRILYYNFTIQTESSRTARLPRMRLFPRLLYFPEFCDIFLIGGSGIMTAQEEAYNMRFYRKLRRHRVIRSSSDFTR